jgi:hypothetical protein
MEITGRIFHKHHHSFKQRTNSCNVHHANLNFSFLLGFLFERYGVQKSTQSDAPK